MEVRCGRTRIVEFIAMHIGMWALTKLYDKIPVGYIILALLSTYPSFLYSFRKFNLDKAGVTMVVLGKFRKYYSWNHFVEKQLVLPRETFYSLSSRRKFEDRYREVIVLSLKPIKRLHKISYAYMYHHPLSCVFIGFENQFPKKKTTFANESAREDRDFEVNREEFISKMKEWGVEIKGLTDQQE